MSNLIVCCADTDTDSVALESEDDSSDTDYIPDGKQSTGMFGFSYSAFVYLTPLPWKYLELGCTLCVESFSGCSGVQRMHAAISSCGSDRQGRKLALC